MEKREVTVLLVEDDDGDYKLVERGFKKAKIANPLRRAVDGIEALETLRGENGQGPLKAPYILLVDINMPRMNGHEFVKAIRSDEHFKSSVIFMLTTSKHDEDKHRAYDLNVAGYILKENAGYDFLELVQLIGAFSRIVELP
jgi:CheY-like chemotaxis protein